MILTYNHLYKLVYEDGVVSAALDNINGASIDITLGNHFKFEKVPVASRPVVRLFDKESIQYREAFVPDGEVIYIPAGTKFLAETKEVFNLPPNTCCKYIAKSSMARNFLDHYNAGWCDPTWHASTLTLELHNHCQYTTLALKPGMKIGQMVFWAGAHVPDEKSYKVKGQYNNQSQAQGSKGIK